MESDSLVPSIDRLDDFKGYSFSNIRLTTWKENREHQYKDIKNGVGTSGARCKTIYKFNADKELICNYVSYNEAQRQMGYSLEYQIKKGVTCRNNFYWSYSDSL